LAVAVTATAAVGVAAAAGDQPPVVPVVQHETAATDADAQKATTPQGGTTNDDDEKKKAAEELAKKLDAQATALATQNQTLKDQAALIEKLKTELDTVADTAGKTKTKAETLETEAKQITANVYGLASGAEAAKTSLQYLNTATDKLAYTTRSIMLANASATRQLDQSLTRLQLATAVTANGAADVSAKVVTAEKKLSDTDRDILRVSTVKDGWLLPLNPFVKYQVTADTIRIVRHALATPDEGPAANVLSVLQGFEGLPPEPIWRFERPLTHSAKPEAQALMKDLMPLILKASRYKGGRNAQ
jgi:archaellum component FlaC